MKKKILSLILTISLLILTGCSSAGAISTYTISLSKMPRNLDPQVATDPAELLVLTNVYDGLFEYADGSIVNNLCESYTVSSDGKTYTFKIKDTSSFYLSKKEQIPVTSHDFVFALDRVLDPKTVSPYYDNFKNISSVKAIDDYTLEIKLKNSDNDLLGKLCMTAAYPCNEDFFNQTNGAYGLRIDDILSNGPFTLNYLADDGSYATLIRVVDKKGGIDRIRISLSDGTVTDGELYAQDKISGYFAPKNGAGKDDHSYESAIFGMVLNPESGVLTNKKVRSALAYYAYAVENSGANLNALTQSRSIFTRAVTLGGTPVCDLAALQSPEYMSRDAKELLREGLAEQQLASTENLSVLIPNDIGYAVIAENINQLWQKNLNLFLSVEFLSSSEIEERIAKGDFDIAFAQNGPKENNALSIIEPFAEYDDKLGECIESIRSTAGSSEQLKYISRAQSIILEDAYLVPMCSQVTDYLHKPYFTDIVINPFGNVVNLKYATVK